MQERVQEILLVSSSYDHFTLEEDGRLNEALLVEYQQLHLTHTPRLSHATTAEEALELIRERSFDLVVSMVRVGDMDVHVFGRLVKEIRPELPVVLLAYNTRELALFREGEGIDRVFVWSGDARILLAIFKLFEDYKNVEHDTRHGDVQVLILVEDSPRFYSIYLPLLFHELMKQTRTLMAEGINLHHRLLRMRARAKILLATTMEEAQGLLDRYSNYVLGVISDAGFPRAGKHDMDAGPELIKQVRAYQPHLPIMLQSSRQEYSRVADTLQVSFLYKNQPQLLKGLRHFMRVNLGFGDFIFTLADGTEIGRAADLESMIKLLRQIPVGSLELHARHNDFSNWFRARTEFELARSLRPRTIDEFEGWEEVRAYLIETLQAFHRESRRGGVADFSRQAFDAESSFLRIGNGSLGGKGRGLAFFNSLLPTLDLSLRFPDTDIFIPKSATIGTAVFDEFVETNDLLEMAFNEASDEGIARAFLKADIPSSIIDDLRTIVLEWRCPLAVRSSSLLEDSQHQPFAGVYNTYMLPNNHPDPEVRLDLLTQAIKLVYASTYYGASKAYISATPNRIEEEKMGVVIQQLVGQTHGQNFYPTFAGVARSYNFYPIGDILPEEGIIAVALGLGRTVVDGGKCLRFSPAHPQRLFQFTTVEETLANSQRQFWALDLGTGLDMDKDIDKDVAIDMGDGLHHPDRDGDQGEGSIKDQSEGGGQDGVPDDGTSGETDNEAPDDPPDDPGSELDGEALAEVNDRPGLDLAPEASLRHLELSVAEGDGQLYALGSVYDPNNEAIYDGTSRAGPRLVTFAGVLKHRSFPLTEILQYLLEVGQEGFSGPVELEFAVELDPLQKLRRLAFLQVRPLIAEAVDMEVDLTDIERLKPLCRSPQAMGNGVIDDILDIVYVHPDHLDRKNTLEVASLIEHINQRLMDERRPYLLIGPGRWGSADPWLGIPVMWGQISGARTIVECDLADFRVTPSQGTHFFQNIVSFGVGYLTVNQGAGEIDWSWLEGQEPLSNEGPVYHLRLERPVKILLDGRTGLGAILKPDGDETTDRG